MSEKDSKTSIVGAKGTGKSTLLASTVTGSSTGYAVSKSTSRSVSHGVVGSDDSISTSKSSSRSVGRATSESEK